MVCIWLYLKIENTLRKNNIQFKNQKNELIQPGFNKLYIFPTFFK